MSKVKIKKLVPKKTLEHVELKITVGHEIAVASLNYVKLPKNNVFSATAMPKENKVIKF